MENYLAFILTTLTIATGVLTIATFAIGRNKDSKHSGERLGVMSEKLDHITDNLEEIKLDVKEVRRTEEQTSIELATLRESTKSAHKRIDALEKRLQKIIDGREAV